MAKTKILLADDHLVVRQGFKALLEREPDFEVIAETGDGIEAVRLAEQHKPTVAVLDLMMPGLNGMQVSRQLTQRLATRTVILSMHADEGYVLESLRNGASAFVLKDASAAELIRAVREAVAGRRYLSPPLSQPAMDTYVAKAKAAGEFDIYETLTNREREVLQLTAESHTAAGVAHRLFISPRTVEAHRAKLMAKLKVHSQAELIRYALQRGLVPMKLQPPLAREP